MGDVEIARAMTPGELEMVKTVFNDTIPYDKVLVHNTKWAWFQPSDTAMTPNGEIYFPPKIYKADFSKENLDYRAWFVHECAHLYQYYYLNWSVKARGAVSREYDYKLEVGKLYEDYKLEQMGDIASDYFTLKNAGTINKPYTLTDYAALMPRTKK